MITSNCQHGIIKVVIVCFHFSFQCGIILGVLLLLLSSHLSKRSCSLLLRSAQTSRRRDFESLGKIYTEYTHVQKLYILSVRSSC